MSPADLINGIFESLGGFFILFSVVKLHREKKVRGVSHVHAAFFTAWGLWNLYFYPHLDQWFSFWGGLLLVTTNAVWLGQLVYYNLLNARWDAEDRAVLDKFHQDDDVEAALVRENSVPLTISAKGLADRTPIYRHRDK